MEFFTEQAPTRAEALQKIRTKYGDRVRILSQRTVRLGGFLGLFPREGVEITGYVVPEGVRTPSSPRRSFDEERRRILELAKSEQSPRDQILEKVLSELAQIKENIQRGTVREDEKEHEHIRRLRAMLEEAEFTDRYIEKTIRRIRDELTLQQIEDFALLQKLVVQWVRESIRIYPLKFTRRPEIFILVGPTGVGKTTTIAKLAAMYGLGLEDNIRYDVRIITIDNYRIAARQQIETYANIMGIPVACVESYEELERQVRLFQDVDIIFVDTIGKSPRDYRKLADMKDMLEACGSRAQTHLALSATTKTADIYTVLQQFEPFNYTSVVLTKLDETTTVGNIISVLEEKGKPISFITNGQAVPHDIAAATPAKLLAAVRGFILEDME
ncbi:flagellar biosynthesis protein FlhF [Spirochaeta thermophila]|uniref:Flagellar biosynthesis protein FlhF n=2 Tax=Winmispira thermophila TaxID=154 RepID=G0GCE5_WINT7|nr:flagellar biosynthesis protein FlhF [Spirochaeta thermophila]ADN01878.1 flagellar-associated GTP-binding protein [Spirochaeta thermophila DSM 6192]AEJ61230.1 flagellar biosynthetic protein FlhF [Spirochaeta thermophila DSM 6578]